MDRPDSFFENVLKESWIPTLKQMSAVRIVQIFATQSNFLILHPCKSDKYNYNDYVGYDDREMKRKVHKLELPETLKTFVAYFAEPVAYSLLQWVHYLDHYIFSADEQNAKKYTKYVLFSPRGEVDYVQSSKNLLSVDGISASEKYKICCNFCLMEEIVLRAPSATIDGQLPDYSSPEYYYFVCQADDNYAWFQILARDYAEAYGQSLGYNTVFGEYHHNEEFLMYLWERLSDEEKMECVEDLHFGLAPKHICFLLLRSNETIVQSIVYKHFYSIFEKFFTNKLWLKFAIPFVCYYGDRVTKHDFNKVLYNFRYDFATLTDAQVYVLEQVWNVAAEDVRDYAYKINNSVQLLRVLNWRRSMRFAKKILSDASDAQRKDMIFSDYGKALCKSFAVRSQFTFLDLFVERGLLGVEDVENFKQMLRREVEPVLIVFARHSFPECVNNFRKWYLRKYSEYIGVTRTDQRMGFSDF